MIERSEWYKERKEIYEELHPETKQGKSQAIGMHKKLNHNVSEIISPTFADDTAHKTGVTPRSVQQDIQIATNIKPEIKNFIQDNPISDNKTELLKLARIEHQVRSARDKRIFDMWMACYTQEEIAEAEECSVQPVKDVILDISANLPKNLKPYADHLIDFDIPLYNVWKYKTDREDKILSMYLACYSQKEIAEEVGYTQQLVSQVLLDLQNNCDQQDSSIFHNFSPELFNMVPGSSKTRGG